MQTALLFETVEDIFRRVFGELKPRTQPPAFEIRYFPYANIDSTIRLQEGHERVIVKISDLLEGAPAPIQEALAHILLRKLYRKPPAEKYNRRYRMYLNRSDVRRKAMVVRQMRGRKRILSAKGTAYNLEEIFEDLNRRFFGGLLARPQLTWSPRRSRRQLGHFDPAHNAIVISRLFDSPEVPRYLVEYIMYHEMLHLKHPVEYRSHRRCVHTEEFRENERRFPFYTQANKLLKEL
jgi:predicted metal-dependent hydrolase